MSDLDDIELSAISSASFSQSKPIKLIRSWEKVRQSARASSGSTNQTAEKITSPSLAQKIDTPPAFSQSETSAASSMSKAEEETSRVVDELFRDFLAHKMDEIETEHSQRVNTESVSVPEQFAVKAEPEPLSLDDLPVTNDMVQINSQTSLSEQERIKHKFDNMKKEILENAKIKAENTITQRPAALPKKESQSEPFIGMPNRPEKKEETNGVFAEVKLNVAKKPAVKMGMLGIKISQTSAELISSGTKLDDKESKKTDEDGECTAASGDDDNDGSSSDTDGDSDDGIPDSETGSISDDADKTGDGEGGKSKKRKKKKVPTATLG